MDDAPQLMANTELIVCSAETLAAHPELFHYTSREAFQGIVTSNTFWAFHCSDMRDTDELLLMQRLLPAAIAPRFDVIAESLNRHDRCRFHKGGGGLSIARDLVNSLYKATFLSTTGFTALDAFSVSFSTHAEDSDVEREHGLSSQWSEYAGHDGFCLVFDTRLMANYLGRELDSRYWVRLALDPVRYANASIEELFPELVNASSNTLRQFLQGVRTPEMAVPEFLAGATLLKGASFQHEREVRIVAIPGTQRFSDRAAIDYPGDFKIMPLPEVRTQPGTKRRYLPIFETINLALPIKRVIVGPSNRQKKNAEFARSLLSNVPVSLSNIRRE
jgi:hypothetical protein